MPGIQKLIPEVVYAACQCRLSMHSIQVAMPVFDQVSMHSRYSPVMHSFPVLAGRPCQVSMPVLQSILELMHSSEGFSDQFANRCGCL